MGLFGLGDFGTGFVEGFAKSANEALKEDLRKVDLRVEKVAEAKLKRALKQQEERAEEMEEVEDALRQAEGLFGKDDPRATGYAAVLLKEQGSASALKAFTEQIKTSDVYKRGEDLANYMELAEREMPTGTRTDFVNAFVRKRTPVSDYRLPESAVTAGAGNLLSAIGLDQDVSGQIDRRVAEQMTAAGIAEQAEITVSLPSGTFMREKFTMGNMTPSKRLEYLNQQLANENNTPERITELQGMLTKTQDAVYATGKEEDRLTVIESKISRAEGDERKKFIEEAANLKRQIKLKAAETSTNPLDLLDAKLEIALAKGLKSGDLSEHDRLKKERERIGKPVDPNEDIKEAKRELAVRVQNGELDINSPEYKTAISAIRQDEIIIDEIYGKGGELDLTAAKSIAGFMQTAIDNDISDKLTGEQRDLFNKASDALSRYNGSREMFKKAAPVLYQQYMDIVAANKDIENAAIERFLSGIPESDKKNRTNALFAAQSAFNYGGEAQAAAAQAVKEVQGGGTDAGTDAAAVGGDGSEQDSINIYPNDTTGANLMIRDAEEAGISISEILFSAEKRGTYGKEFLDILRNKQMSTIATADAGIPAETEEYRVPENDILTTITHPIENAAAKMFLDGMNPNEIAKELRQRYKNDPSYDSASLSSSISTAIAKVQQYSEKVQTEKEKAAKLIRERLEKLNKDKGAGLMSRR